MITIDTAGGIQAYSFGTLGEGGHLDVFAVLKRLPGLLNQAIIAQEDVKRFYDICRVSAIIAAAVCRQLTTQWVRLSTSTIVGFRVNLCSCWALDIHLCKTKKITPVQLVEVDGKDYIRDQEFCGKAKDSLKS